VLLVVVALMRHHKGRVPYCFSFFVKGGWVVVEATLSARRLQVFRLTYSAVRVLALSDLRVGLHWLLLLRWLRMFG